MKNIIIIFFALFSFSLAAQTNKTFKYSQSGFEGNITLQALMDSAQAEVGTIPTITTAINQVAYSSVGAPNLVGSAAFGFNGTRVIINRAGSFTDLGTLSVQKAAADSYVQYWRNATTIGSAIDSLGWIIFRTGANKVGLGGMSSAGLPVDGTSSVALGGYVPGGTLTGGNDFWLKSIAPAARTSGNNYGFRLERSFAPTGGTATYGGFTQRDTINQTGGASGITWGFWAAPVLTAAADYRAFRYDASTGTGLYFSGTAPNYLAGTLGVGGVTRGASENWFSATDTYITPSDSLKLKGASVNIEGAVKITGNTTNIGHVLFTDNTYDIGASGATRPRNIYVAGTGIFGGDVTVPTEVYDATGWNGDLTAPTKDAVRDKIEALAAASGFTSGANTITANTTFDGTFDWRMGNSTTLDTVEVKAARVILNGITATEIFTNSTKRVTFDSGGGIRSNTVTDWRMTPSDSFELRVGSNGWLGSTAFSRLIANGLVSLQANHSTGAVAMVLPDNTASAYTMSISGGATVLSATTTDGAEATGIGTASAGGTLNLVSEKTIFAGSVGVARRTITASGTTALAQGDYYVRLDATAGAQTITLPSPTYNMVLKFKRVDNNAGTAIIFTGTVDGTTNPNSTTGGSPIIGLATQYGNLELTWNGTNWDVSE